MVEKKMYSIVRESDQEVMETFRNFKTAKSFFNKYYKSQQDLMLLDEKYFIEQLD